MIRKEPSKSSPKTPHDSPEPDLHIRFVLQVYRVHKTHPRRGERHDDGLRPGPVAKEAHALQEITVGDATGGKDNLAPGRQFVGGVNLHGIPNAHGMHALALLLV